MAPCDGGGTLQRGGQGYNVPWAHELLQKCSFPWAGRAAARRRVLHGPLLPVLLGGPDCRMGSALVSHGHALCLSDPPGPG